jgi:drug/metabolite transporter (DMT)-like permease
MALPDSFLSAAFSLGAVFVWGTSDFVGGYAAKRANAFVVTLIAHVSGMLLMATLALFTHAPFLSRHGLGWAIAAGFAGGATLAIFYRALAAGNMGLTAPVAAVLGAAIPTVFGMITEGFPGSAPIAGFVLAVIGIWLISRSEDDRPPQGIGLALLAGVGFAGFYLCARQAGNESSLWISAFSKGASAALTGAIVLWGGKTAPIQRPEISWGVVAGFLDVTGTVFFIRASQSGRLDSAVVLSSLYPVVTVLLAKLILREHFTRWKAVGMVAALLAVPLIAMQ